jgi:hypothetical protein
MKTVKYVTVVLTIAFVGIVLLEQVPGVMTATVNQYESLMFNLFEISLLDDITHGVSGLLGLFAIWGGYRMMVKYLILVGGYYTLDALFFVINGFATGQSLTNNFLLNGPHIAISIAVYIALKASIIRLELK